MATKTPTQKEIQKNLKWLKENRDKVRHYTMFGEDNHAKIDAEIEVLKADLSEDDIYERSYGEDDDDQDKEWNPSQRDSALNARHWLDGEEEISPIKSWEALVSK